MQQDINNIRLVNDVYEQTREGQERFVKLSGDHQETTEYASDSSNGSYKEIREKQTERKNSSPVAVSSAFTIDNILGRHEERDTDVSSSLNNSEDRDEEQDEREEKVEESQFIKPTAIPAAHSGT